MFQIQQGVHLQIGCTGMPLQTTRNSFDENIILNPSKQLFYHKSQYVSGNNGPNKWPEQILTLSFSPNLTSLHLLLKQN